MGVAKIPASWANAKNEISHVKKAHGVVTSLETLDREADSLADRPAGTSP